MSKILDYGSLNIDMVFSVDHITIPGETNPAAGLKKSAGGKGANQASALVKSGTGVCQVYMGGKIGADGAFLLKLLREYGVNTDNVRQDDGPNGQALIQVDAKGQNAILYYSGANSRISVNEIDETLAAFGAGDVLVLQNEIVHTAEIMQTASKRGLKIVLNPSPFNDSVKSLPLDLVDIFFVNEIEGADMAGLPQGTDFTKIIETLAKKFYKAEIVLTVGKKGAYYCCAKDGGKVLFSDIVDAPVVDTTGAGDTFSGYFIASRVRGLQPQAALDIASKASAIAVSRPGAMQSVPQASEVF
jgi:ribokinase